MEGPVLQLGKDRLISRESLGMPGSARITTDMFIGLEIDYRTIPSGLDYLNADHAALSQKAVRSGNVDLATTIDDALGVYINLLSTNYGQSETPEP